MSQDASKIVLAAALSNHKDIGSFDVDPAGFPAGLCVSLASTGLPSLAKADGSRYGVSRGKSLSDHLKTVIQQAGLRVPVQAALTRSTGLITITSVANLVSGADDAITIGGTALTAQAGAATPGDATFQASGTTAQTATSLATQINAHAVISTKVYAVASGATVRLYAKVEGAGTGHDVTVTYTDNDTNVGATLSELAAGKLDGGSNTTATYITVGTKMYINDVTGKADVAMTGFSTISDAVYVSGLKSGIQEDGTEVGAALVDMQGGL